MTDRAGERRRTAEEKIDASEQSLEELEQEIVDEVAEIDEKWDARPGRSTRRGPARVVRRAARRAGARVGTHRLIRALALGILSLAGCAAEDSFVARQTARAAAWRRIADGDTLRLTDGRRIRLVQIDAPEPGSECFGAAAGRELAGLAPPGSDVELERDPSLDDHDRFGRLLRYVSVEGDNLNLALVERGAAAPYFFRGERGRYADDLLDAAEAAQPATGASGAPARQRSFIPTGRSWPAKPVADHSSHAARKSANPVGRSRRPGCAWRRRASPSPLRAASARCPVR